MKGVGIPEKAHNLYEKAEVAVCSWLLATYITIDT